MSKGNRKSKAAKHLNHVKTFHSSKKAIPLLCAGTPKKSIEDLTDYEVDQIWAEAMHIYKTEGFDPEQAEQEFNELLQKDPEVWEVSVILSKLLSSKSSKFRDVPPVSCF